MADKHYVPSVKRIEYAVVDAILFDSKFIYPVAQIVCGWAPQIVSFLCQLQQLNPHAGAQARIALIQPIQQRHSAVRISKE